MTMWTSEMLQVLSEIDQIMNKFNKKNHALGVNLELSFYGRHAAEWYDEGWKIGPREEGS